MSTTPELYCKYLIKPVTAGVIGGIATTVLAPSVANLRLTLFGMEIPVWAFSGASCAVGSILGQVTTDYISPQITTISLLSAPAHTALNVGMSAGGTALAYSMAGVSVGAEFGIAPLFAISAIYEVGSSYITESWAKPALIQYMN